MAWPYGKDPATGSRLGPAVRLGNKQLRDIPPGQRLLEVTCAAGGSRKGGPRLIAVVTPELTLHGVATQDAASPGRLYAPCRCAAGGHVLDTARVAEAAIRLRGQPRKARRIDAARVAAGPSSTGL